MLIRNIALATLAASALLATVSPSDARVNGRYVSVNPQPLPQHCGPCRWFPPQIGRINALNPQPLPPGRTMLRR